MPVVVTALSQAIHILFWRIRYRFFLIHLAIRRILKLDRLSSIESLDEAQSVAFFFRQQSARFHWLKNHLKEVPYWAFGHLEIARLGLVFQELDLAYGSIVALGQLKPGEKIENEARLLLSHVYTARGRFEDALQSLQQCKPGVSVSPEQYYEAKAAALIGLKRLDEAREALEYIPEDKRDPSMSAALAYTKGDWKKDSST